MQTLNVRDILYILTGGSNTLALMRDEGVLLVDTKPAGWGRAILDNIESVTDQPVTTIINTHAHADHAGGNVEFPDATRSSPTTTPRPGWRRWTPSAERTRSSCRTRS